jgi:hypothetical protein
MPTTFSTASAPLGTAVASSSPASSLYGAPVARRPLVPRARLAGRFAPRSSRTPTVAYRFLTDISRRAQFSAARHERSDAPRRELCGTGGPATCQAAKPRGTGEAANQSENRRCARDERAVCWARGARPDSKRRSRAQRASRLGRIVAAAELCGAVAAENVVGIPAVGGCGGGYGCCHRNSRYHRNNHSRRNNHSH